MIDMTAFIAARSDQLNADDLLDAPRTITITKVTAQPDAAEQPVSVHYEGDTGKPFKPCKTVRRIMVGVWGKDASQYVGRSMTLYRDPDVQFGGMKLGGIRVSHMSHIDGEKTVALQVTRGRKAPFTVKPLKGSPAGEQADASGLPPVENKQKQTAEEWTERYIADVKGCETIEALMDLQSRSAKALARLQSDRPELHELTTNAGTKRAADLQSAEPEFSE